MIDAPKYNELMFPTLEAVKALGGSAKNQEIYDWIVESGKYTDEQLEVLHTNGNTTKVEYNLGWARTYLKKFGALESKGGGLWLLTPFGATATEEMLMRQVVDYQKDYQKKWKEKKQKEKDEITIDDIDEENNEISSANNWQENLLDTVKGITPEQFERLSQRILREQGFNEVRVTGRSSDGGIDGVGILRVNLISFQIVFQCKRYKGSVGSSIVRDFRGAMQGRADKGLIITTGTFTTEARREATRDGASAIDLIDGEEFCKLLKSLSLGVTTTTKMVEDITIEKEFFESF